MTWYQIFVILTLISFVGSSIAMYFKNAIKDEEQRKLAQNIMFGIFAVSLGSIVIMIVFPRRQQVFNDTKTLVQMSKESLRTLRL